MTGGSGFVGGWLKQWLEECGDETSSVPDSVDIRDKSSLESVFKNLEPDVIYHLAALSHVGESWAEPEEVFKVNSLGTLCLLESIKSLKKAPRVIIISSAEVYGVVTQDELPLAETSELRPSTPYAASKVASEFIGLQEFRGANQDVIIVRPFNHVGPKQSERFVVSALAKRIVSAQINKEAEILVGNLESRRDYTDVRDVVKAYRLLAQSGKSGEIYNVASGNHHSVNELVQIYLDLVDCDIELIQDPNLSRASDIPVLCGNNRKLVDQTGWQQTIDLRTTLADTLEYWRSKLKLES